MTDSSVVIVGAGQAGSETATALRQQGWRGPITVIGDETHLPYRRPPLSKGYLAGDATAESLIIKPAATFEKAGIAMRTGIGVEAIDRAGRQLRLFDGTQQAYDKLVLATGGRPRRLALPGAEHPNVHYVRRIDDIERLRGDFVSGARMVIVGGGYIGLEVAAVGIKCGLHVTIVEAQPRVLARVTAAEVSAFYERFHRDKGVQLRTGVGVHALEGEPRVQRVVLADGESLAADLVVVGIGIEPNTELAQAAGLAVRNGIVADAQCRTSDPDIFAIGDCSLQENRFYQTPLRLESVPNAMEHARIVAAALCGTPPPAPQAPWFWSDQFELKLQMVGLSEGHDQVVLRGDPASNSFLVFYLRAGCVIAVDSISRAPEFSLAKRIVGERLAPDPALLADESRPLRALFDPPG